MRIHELLGGRPLRETEYDDLGTGTSTPLATIAAPGAAPGAASVDPEIALTSLKPLRRLRHLKRGAIKN
jgi:hypothetical protein